MLHEYMDKLVEDVTTKEFSEEIIKAKKEYFSTIGEIFEDDKSFENRMVSFIEWYCFDRISKKYGKPPLEHFIDVNSSAWDKKDNDVYTGFLLNIHSIFYLKKIKKGHVIVEDMCESKKFTVIQNQTNLFFQKGDIFEARLVPVRDEYHFSGSFCFHPNELYRKIKRELKKVSYNRTNKNEFLTRLSTMSLKLERSRRQNYKDFYPF